MFDYPSRVASAEWSLGAGFLGNTSSGIGIGQLPTLLKLQGRPSPEGPGAQPSLECRGILEAGPGNKGAASGDRNLRQALDRLQTIKSKQAPSIPLVQGEFWRRLLPGEDGERLAKPDAWSNR